MCVYLVLECLEGHELLLERCFVSEQVSIYLSIYNICACAYIWCSSFSRGMRRYLSIHRYLPIYLSVYNISACACIWCSSFSRGVRLLTLSPWAPSSG